MFLRLFYVLAALVVALPAQAVDAWRVTKTEWSAADEDGYSAFIQRIGDSGCETPDDCINSNANPYRGTDGRGINFNADCADLVYMLRAYYAWKNGLPFSYVTGIYARGGGDVRFSPKGNRVSGRHNITGGESGRSVIYAIRDAISSASYRVGPDVDGDPRRWALPGPVGAGGRRPAARRRAVLLVRRRRRKLRRKQRL